jgi:hypothetical protein
MGVWLPRMKWASAVAAAILLSCCSLSSSSAPASHPSPVTTPSPVPSASPVARQVLPPARSLPVVALCSQPLTTDQNGNSVPLLCTNGGLNVLAWEFFVPLTPRVLSTGPTASVKSVQTALCSDAKISHATVLQELSAYDLAAAYYGWNFSTDPTDILYSMSTCPR